MFCFITVPSGTGNNITAGAITTNSINITWTSVKPMEKRGDVIFYNVSLINVPHYWQSSSDVHELFLIRNQTLLQNGVMSLLFEDLNNHTSYRVSIAAYTAIGAGLTSEEVIYTTRQNSMSLFYILLISKALSVKHKVFNLNYMIVKSDIF